MGVLFPHLPCLSEYVRLIFELLYPSFISFQLSSVTIPVSNVGVLTV